MTSAGHGSAVAGGRGGRAEGISDLAKVDGIVEDNLIGNCFFLHDIESAFILFTQNSDPFM